MDCHGVPALWFCFLGKQEGTKFEEHPRPSSPLLYCSSLQPSMQKNQNQNTKQNCSAPLSSNVAIPPSPPPQPMRSTNPIVYQGDYKINCKDFFCFAKALHHCMLGQQSPARSLLLL